MILAIAAMVKVAVVAAPPTSISIFTMMGMLVTAVVATSRRHLVPRSVLLWLLLTPQL